MASKNLQPRHDRAGNALAASTPRIFTGRIARIHRPGDALRYRVPRRDGTHVWREELRDLAELEKIKKQVVGRPLALRHPPFDPRTGGMFMRGAKGKVVGVAVDARLDGEWVEVDYEIHDDAAVEAHKNGISELSLGYICDLDGDGYQRNTIVDHSAMVEQGRCGDSCAIVRTDCACESDEETFEEPLIAAGPVNISTAERADQGCPCKGLANSLVVGQSASHMPLDEANAKALDDVQKQLADVTAENAALKARADQAEKAVEEQKTRADHAEKAKEAVEIELDNARKDLKVRTDSALVSEAVAAEKTRADQAETDRDAQKARADQAEAAIEKVRADEASARADAIEAAVTSKLELISRVAPMNLTAKDADGKDQPLNLATTSERDIKIAAVIHVDGDDLTGKSADWINGVFEGAMKRYKVGAKSRSDARDAVVQMREQAAPKTAQPTNLTAASKKAKDAQRARLSELWKTTSTDKKDQ